MHPRSISIQVLLAEGDPVQKMLLREYLEFVASYQVLEAQGVFHLLALCEAHLHWPSILLLDMEWSQIEGVDLILEGKRRVPGLPILRMTDRQADLHDHPRLRCQSVNLIQKPFSPFHLHRRLSAILASHGWAAANGRWQAHRNTQCFRTRTETQ